MSSHLFYKGPFVILVPDETDHPNASEDPPEQEVE